jgi:hypothetical protein
MSGPGAGAPGEVTAVLVAVLGAGLSITGTCLYLRDIRRGRTTPHRGSWLVWTVIGVVAALSHGADGGRWSLLVLTGQALASLVVLGAAVRHGVGWLTPANLLMLAVAAFGVLGWLMLTDPTAATVCAAVADGAGLVAILPKAWADPTSETTATYALAGLTGLLAALAVQAWDRDLLLFPIYFCVGNTATAAFIFLRRRTLVRGAGSVRSRSSIGCQPPAAEPQPVPVPVRARTPGLVDARTNRDCPSVPGGPRWRLIRMPSASR